MDSLTNPPIDTPILSHSYLIQRLAYDCHTGRFTWRDSLKLAGGLWNKGKYRSVWISGRGYKASRLAWFYVYGKWPLNHIDHINGNTLDDRISNLRDVSQRENNSNLERHRMGSLVGASYSKKWRKKHWMARIKTAGKTENLGYFLTELEAHEAYKKAKAIHDRLIKR